MGRSWERRFLAGLLVLALTACGGGGGGGTGGGSDGGTVPADDSPRQPRPTLVRDDNPSTPRLSVGPDDYLPTADTQWDFDRLDSTGARVGSSRLLLQVHSASTSTLAESDETHAPQITELQRGPHGWSSPAIAGSELPASVNAAIGTLLRLPSPFHAIGSTRVQFRSGSFGVDLDGDGVHESFEFTYRQTMVGEEQVAGPRGPITAMHIRDEWLVTVIPSKRSLSDLKAAASSDFWLAKGLGFVREQVRSVGSEGGDVFPPYTLALRAVRIAGIDPLDVNSIQNVVRIPLVHRGLVYDAARRRYYASVPGTAGAQGNRLATIDADTGALTLSDAIGSNPGALALASDGASLYVSLDGSSELLRLSLPGLAELGRVRLPLDASFGTNTYAESLAASPVQPGVVAVSLAQPGISPRHAGVALLRDMVVMPLRTGSHTGSNSTVFSADGLSLYGINNETTEFGLRRIEVLADGLAERQVVQGALSGFYIGAIDRDGNRLVVGNRLYAADTLAPLGVIEGGAVECRALPGSLVGGRVACLSGSLFGAGLQLTVASQDTAVVLAQLGWPGTGQQARRILVAGPSGQLAVRDGISHPGARDGDAVLILRHPALP